MSQVTLPDLIAAIRDQLINRLSLVTDVVSHVEAGLFNIAETPAINIYTGASSGAEEGLASFKEQFGGIPVSIRVRVSPADIEAGEDLLWRYMDDEADPLSIVAALDYDRTLGGVAQTLSWGNGWPWSGYTAFPDLNLDGEYVGAVLSLVVVKAHS